MIRWDKQRGKWRVDVGEKWHEFIGRYDSWEDALTADRAARKAYQLAEKKSVVTTTL